MNGISSLLETGAQAGTKTVSNKQSLGKDDFLKLLVAQLKNQDPLKPSDPTEFTAQLAQYSSLEQLHNINESMQAFNSIQEAFGRLSALSLIDKYIVSDSDAFEFEGDPLELGFRFQDSIDKAVVHVKNASGQILDQIDVKNPVSGENRLNWDGTAGDGRLLNPGSYSFSVIGTTAEGNEIQGTTFVESRVTGVDYSDGDNALLTTSGRTTLSEIIRVKNPTRADGQQE